MLSRAALRSSQAPRLRALPVRFLTSSSPVWSRNNRPNSNQNQKKPTEYSRAPEPNLPLRPGGATTAPGAGARPDFSRRQAEVDKGATPERNTVPRRERGTEQQTRDPTKKESQKLSDTADFSANQNEFDTEASPSSNTAPQGSSPSAIDPAEAQARTQPLPDLRYGIPSTLEFETSQSRSTPLNLTEAEDTSTESGGGRGRGDLPDSAYISSSEKKRLKVANYMYALFAASVIGGTIYLGRNWDTEEEESVHPNAPSGWALGPFWNRAKARLGDQLNYYNEPAFRKLLPDVDPIFERPYTLVLSMEDLLIHSEWSREHGWRLAKRPGVDYFLRYLSQYYELVIFTTQPSALAEPVIRKLDPYHIITWPLFREATLYENGEYVKDLSYLNRDLSKVIMLDTKAVHAKNQPQNAIILKPWEGDVKDKELVSLIPFLEYIHTMAYTDVRKAISSFEGEHIPTEFAKREAIARKKFQEQLAEEQKKRPKHSGLGFLGNALGIKHQPMMMDPLDQSPAEAFAQGKMLQDQARERGQRNYELLEKEIRENGEKWLKEEAAFEEKAKEEGMKAMKSGFSGWFGGSDGGEKK